MLSKTTKRANLLFIEANLDGTIGGSHYCLLEIIGALDRSKFSPSAIFFEHNALESKFKKLCPVYVFNRHNRLNFSRLLPDRFKQYVIIHLFVQLLQKTLNLFLFSIPDFVKILLFLRKTNTDLVHLNNAPYLSDWLIACKMLGIKCTAHLRGNWPLPPTSLRSMLIKHYDAVVAISKSVKEYLDNQSISIGNSVIINDGINIDLYNTILPKNSSEYALTTSLQERVIGVVGNIKPWKGQHVLIEAINMIRRTLPNIKCFIVGDVGRMPEDKGYYTHLTKIVKQLNLDENVIFTGFQRDVLRLISNFEVLVHTSIEPEPMGRVILEGMLLAKPVIATAHGGPLEIIQDGNSGFLVPPNDPTSLAEILLTLLCDSSLREKIGRQARRRIEEEFNLRNKIIALECLYGKVLSEN